MARTTISVDAHLLVRGRNAESLRRLKRLAERAPRPRPAGT